MEIVYDKFIAEIYDYSPCFGQARALEPDKFNGFYYKEITDKNDKILEFGSGTGPLTIPFAKKGFKMDSVDIFPHMHNVIREKLKNEDDNTRKNINLIETDALKFQGKHLYDKIVMPEGIIISLADQKMQMALLESCNKNLRIGGRIYFDCFQPYYDIINGKTKTHFTRFTDKNKDKYILKTTYVNDEYTQI